jgi:hypothetical protein
VASVDAAIAILAPHGARLQGVALTASGARRRAVADRLRALGVSYLCEAGRLQSPGASWRNGGVDLVELLAIRTASR